VGGACGGPGGPEERGGGVKSMGARWAGFAHQHQQHTDKSGRQEGGGASGGPRGGAGRGRG
jgi:hypothetical protein